MKYYITTILMGMLLLTGCGGATLYKYVKLEQPKCTWYGRVIEHKKVPVLEITGSGMIKYTDAELGDVEANSKTEGLINKTVAVGLSREIRGGN